MTGAQISALSQSAAGAHIVEEVQGLDGAALGLADITLNGIPSSTARPAGGSAGAEPRASIVP